MDGTYLADDARLLGGGALCVRVHLRGELVEGLDESLELVRFVRVALRWVARPKVSEHFVAARMKRQQFLIRVRWQEA